MGETILACAGPSAVSSTLENDIWVAVVDGHPVGFVVCLIEEGAARAGEIHMIAVDPLTSAQLPRHANRPYDRRVFSTRERDNLRDRLIAAARDDERIAAAALVGSSASAAEDAWSDIDLALRLSDGLQANDVAGDWTTRMYDRAGAVDHLDVWSGTTLFRVFLLDSSLQVDLSFWAFDTFAATGSPFRLLFGEANEPQQSCATAPGALVGMGWLYALHARSSLARGRTLQALYMINGVRDQVVALACLRHDLPAHQGRGVDDLPAGLRQIIEETLVRELGESELRRAFAAALSALLDETQQIDPDRERRLGDAVRELARL